MHVLVTGAGGFTGSVLVKELLARGHYVTAVVGSRTDRLSELNQFDKLDVVARDLSGDFVLPTGIDAIVHAAARSPEAGTKVDDLVRDNVIATRRLVQQAQSLNVRKFIYFSTVSIYGIVQTPVVDESTPVFEPDVYAQTKRIGEEIVTARENIFDSLVIRLPGVIGRNSVRNWLTNVLAAARDGLEIQVFNADEPFNNAVHVADLSCFISDVIGREWVGSDVVTLGAAGQMPVGEVVGLLVDAYGGRSPVKHVASSKRGFIISSERARVQYGYKPMEIGNMLRRFAAENAG